MTAQTSRASVPDNAFVVEAERLLAELGDTPDAVAGSLLERGVRGRTDDPEYCPVACYLRNAGLPVYTVMEALEPKVTFDTLEGEPGQWYRPPPAVIPDVVAQFARRFDGNEWPALVGEPA